MFKNKQQVRSIHYKGHYLIELPFFGHRLYREENEGTLKAKTVLVEVIVGSEPDSKRNKLATVIIHEDNEGYAVQNFYEEISSILMQSYLPKFMSPVHFELIEWVDFFSNPYDKESKPHVVSGLKWDEKKARVHGDLRWTQVKEEWYVDYLSNPNSHSKENWF
ncbi:hypothetical protein [Shouchella miscanthi]|uniref:Uncharacterized protein n=1 Tax=Shouchella miscanthi TaxID=2598861 RepID=A0ABU6NJM3_9BACI|nr:hypothetical protein [Shouchella miscanthi]